jgi:hypothetical protein
MTINSALSSVPLPRATSEGDIRRIMTNITFSTRPANAVNITARYRLYDFNDRTPDFGAFQIVEYDQALEGTPEPVGEEEPEPEFAAAHFSNRYNTFEAQATFTSLRAVSFGAGYRFNRVSYTEREITRTTDNAVFVNADSTGLGMVSLHASYEHGRRRSPDFGSLALADLAEGGEYPGLRRYDIADRNRDSLTAMLQVMPMSLFAISASATIARNNYPNEQASQLALGARDFFGLQNDKMQGYSISFDATPNNNVTVGAGYGFQKYSSLQQSRRVDTDPATPAGQAQRADPNRNWSLTEDDKVHYITANVELAQVIPKTALRVTYDYNRADAPYTYVVGSTLAATRALAPIAQRWHTAIVDFRYFIRRNLAAGLTYWFDRFTTDDFALGPQITDKVALPGIVMLGYGFRPYKVNSVWGRVMFIF